METLAERLKFLRLKRGFKSKSVAAQAMEISYGTYQGYEYGLFPGRSNYKKISDFYGCSLLWLRDGEGDPYPKSGIPEPSVGAAYIKEEQAAWTADGAAYKMNVDDAMGKTYKVLSSGTPYAVALYLNIQQFSGALDATQELHACQDRITNLETQVDALRRQVEGLTAPPASSDQQADSLEKEAM